MEQSATVRNTCWVNKIPLKDQDLIPDRLLKHTLRPNSLLLDRIEKLEATRSKIRKRRVPTGPPQPDYASWERHANTICCRSRRRASIFSVRDVNVDQNSNLLRCLHQMMAWAARHHPEDDFLMPGLMTPSSAHCCEQQRRRMTRHDTPPHPPLLGMQHFPSFHRTFRTFR